MNEVEAALSRVARDLDDLGRPWALVGALAVAARAEARTTLDVDVAVGTNDPADAEAVVRELRGRGYRWEASFGTAMTSLGIPTGSPPELRLDLLFSLAGIEDEVARGADRIAITPTVTMPVARRGHLVALKLLAAREPTRDHDRRDLVFLLRGATRRDLEEAAAAIELLERRGVVGRGVLGADLERARAAAS